MSERARRKAQHSAEVAERDERRAKALGSGVTLDAIRATEAFRESLGITGQTPRGSAAYVITASRNRYEWFDFRTLSDCDAGRAFEALLEARQDARLAGWCLTLYRGERDGQFTMSMLAELSELL